MAVWWCIGPYDILSQRGYWTSVAEGRRGEMECLFLGKVVVYVERC